MPETFTFPPELAAKFAMNRVRYGNLVMMADEQTPDSPGQDTQQDDDGDHDDQKLGEAGLRALQAERDARKQLQKEVDALKGAQQTLDKLAEAFAKDGTPDPGADLAAQVAELTQWRRDREAEDARDAQAREVAREAGITDVADVALIRAQASKESMVALAERLKAPTAGDGKRMRPDPSQGLGGSGDRTGSVAEAKQARLDQINKNKS